MSIENDKNSSFVIRQKIRALLQGRNVKGIVCVYDCVPNKNGKEKRTLLSKSCFDDLTHIGDIIIEVIYQQKQVRV